MKRRKYFLRFIFSAFALLGLLIVLIPKQVEAALGDWPDIYVYKYESEDIPSDETFSNLGGQPNSYDITTAPNMTGKTPIANIVFELKLIKQADLSDTYQEFKNSLREPDAFNALPIYAVTDAQGIAHFHKMASRKYESLDPNLPGFDMEGSPSLLSGVYELREIAASEYQNVHDLVAYHESNPNFPTKIPDGVIPNTKIYRLELPYFKRAVDPYVYDPNLTDEENDAAYLAYENEVSNSKVVNLHIQAKNQTGDGMIRIKKNLRSDPLKDDFVIQPDIQFKLYDSNFVEITKNPKTGVPLGELRTDGRGYLKISGLALGATYYLKEVAPIGTIPEYLGYRKFVSEVPDLNDKLTNDTTNDTNREGVFINNIVTKRVSADEGQTFEKETTVATEKPFIYRIAARVPDKGQGSITKFQLVDQLKEIDGKYYTYLQSDSQLEQLKDVSVTVNNQDLSAENYQISISAENKKAVANKTGSTQVVGFTLKFLHPENLTAGDKVEVRLKGILINESVTKETKTIYPNEVKEEVSYKNTDGTEEHYVISDIANVKTEKGYFEIKKIESTTNKPLANAEFSLYRGKAPDDLTKVDEENLVATGLTTDNEGVYKSKEDRTHSYTVKNQTFYLADGLVLGDYYLVETLAPTGHKRLMTPIALEIKKNSNGNVVVKTIENDEQYWNVPDTGGMGVYLLIVCGLCSIGIFAIWQIRRLKDAR